MSADSSSRGTTAPLGTHRLASEFLAAALKVQPVASSAAAELAQPISLAAFYLLGHSIELLLKAFLLGRGTSIKELRNSPYGHNLAALLGEARRRKLGAIAKLSRQDIAIIATLNECYMPKELEYAFTGARRLPHYSASVALAKHLLTALSPYCRSLAAEGRASRMRSRRARPKLTARSEAPAELVAYEEMPRSAGHLLALPLVLTALLLRPLCSAASIEPS